MENRPIIIDIHPIVPDIRPITLHIRPIHPDIQPIPKFMPKKTVPSHMIVKKNSFFRKA